MADTRGSLLERCAGCWFGWLCRLILILTGKRRGSGCVYIPERIINRPDPCIYSQFLLMQLQQPVTWDNPDVKIFRGGVEQYTYDLLVDTVYDVVVTVHNSSRDKPALGTTVEIEWVEFGAGAEIRHPIATQNANVPVWPGTIDVVVQWRTPANPGHYCIEVDLSHPNDGNPANNRGWNNTQVHTAASEVRAPMRVFNKFPRGCPPVQQGGDAVSYWRVLLGYAFFGLVIAPLLAYILRHHDVTWTERVLFAIGGYAAGALLGLFFETLRAAAGKRRTERAVNPDNRTCNFVEMTVDSYEFVDGVGKAFDPEAAFAGKPPVWPARVEPNPFAFAPGEAFRDVELIVNAPDPPGPAAQFNVNVWQAGMPTGGATFTINRREA